MTNRPCTYQYEQQLVDAFCLALNDAMSPWGNVSVAREFGYQIGRTDVVAVDDQDTIIAFEAKLSRWRDALHQAYRNTCFAHFSFVVVPDTAASLCIKHLDEFGRRGIGLCYVQDGRIIVAIEASQQVPLQAWLAATAVQLVRQCTYDSESYH